jgi:hypothetical protein
VNCPVNRNNTAFSASVRAENTEFRRRFRQPQQKNAGFVVTAMASGHTSSAAAFGGIPETR